MIKKYIFKSDLLKNNQINQTVKIEKKINLTKIND